MVIKSKMMRKNLEIAIETVEGAMISEQNGADRIELCSALELGGLSPSVGLMKEVRDAVSIPIFALIRPRSGDFLYSKHEFKTIIEDVLEAKKQKLDGIVVGFLDETGNIDVPKIKTICELAFPLKVTFHRAFDRCINPILALEQIIDSGCVRILTSGQSINALEGAELISHLVKQANQRISIMAGAGVRANNVSEIVRKTGVFEVHSSARYFAESKMNYRNSGVSMGQKSGNEFLVPSVDANMVKEIRRILDFS